MEPTDKIMQAPCCDNKYHTLCGIYMIKHAISFHNNAICGCGAILYENNYAYNSESEDTNFIEELRAKPEVISQVKIMKKKIAEEKKALAAYKRHIREKAAEFKDAIQPHVESITTIKTAILNEIKTTEVHKKYKRLRSSCTILENKMKKAHNLNRHNFRRLIGQYNRYHYWNSSKYMLKRKFRIRL